MQKQADPKTAQEAFIEAQKNEQSSRAWEHAASVGTGMFTLGLAAQQLIHLARKKEKEAYRKKLKSYVSSKYPVVTPTAYESPEDIVKEEGMGVDEAKLDKNASVTFRSVFDRFFNIVPMDPNRSGNVWDIPMDIAKALTNPQTSSSHLALATLAALGGGMLGAQVGKKISANTEEEELDVDTAKHKADLDKLMYAEFRRTRGLDKKAEYNPESESPKGQGGVVGPAINLTSKLYLLYAAAAGILAHNVAKGFMDKKDPARAREKALLEFAKQKARMTGVPQLQLDPDDPTYSKLMEKTPEKPSGDVPQLS